MMCVYVQNLTFGCNAKNSKSMYYRQLAKNQQKKVVYDDYNNFLCSLFNKKRRKYV